ncbi:MAG TPA: S24 family peptidase [Candidatus Paceibacterota bacterium]|nr:S24 family peptidase [Candidatus Paceibacterota bacterium]
MHQIQEKILKLLESKNLSGITLREIGNLIDEKFPQKIKHHLDQLEKKGFLKTDKKTKSVQKTSRNSLSNTDLINIPIVGTANCGPATIFANENIEGYLKISKNILKKCKRIFAIKARGLSMNNASIDGKNIEDGDYLIIDSDSTDPKNGDIVLSVIDDMANIKKYVWDDENNQVVLVSESTKDIPPIYIHEDDSFMINGKVIQIIKRPKFI